MKFKTVSEFIHALEVEGKKFVHPTKGVNYLVFWEGSIVREKSAKDRGDTAWPFNPWSTILTHDWQEYIPEPETEEIELEEWLVSDGAHYFVRWVEKGATLPLKEAFKTGVTRKVKVPK